MGEAARRAGLPVETLRYYDRAGLLGGLPRTLGNHRLFDEAAMGLLDVVVRLRRTGMPIQDVRRFSELVARGDDEIGARLGLLQIHRDRVLADLQRLRTDLAVIEWKIAAYRATQDGTDVPAPPPGWPDPGPDGELETS